MKKSQITGARAGEQGNVLFLILIAVALFAALSYAVTQSSRSGSGDANSEKNLVSGAEVTQYPAGVRTAIVRMVISNNVSVDELYFDQPSAFATALTTTADQQRGVFHPLGGGATYQQASPDVMESGGQGTWYFNALFSVPNIGTTSSGSDTSGNDLIAFLPGLKSNVCQKIDDQLGISTVPVVASAITGYNVDQTKATGFPATAGTPIGTTEVSGQPFACFQNGASGPYIYYHVLIER